jgi:hypothetical protein
MGRWTHLQRYYIIINICYIFFKLINKLIFYLGQFKNNIREGEGELRWADGNIYKGIILL